MKIALAQINPTVGDFEKNSEKIVSYIKKAKKEQCELVIFPELALCGYPPQDLLLKPHFIQRNLQYLKKIQLNAKGIKVIVGFVDKRGGNIYNALALLQNKKIADIYHKNFLPNYGVFDEKRYFSEGSQVSIYDYAGELFSANICEDIWHKRNISVLKGKNLSFLVNISASPFYLGKLNLRRAVLSKAAKELKTTVIYCNLAGGQDELVFDGTSMVFNPQGKLIKVGRRFEEDFITFDTEKRYSVKKLPINKIKDTFSALCLGLKDYVRKNGFEKVVLGISGGIDSSLVASIAAICLGKNNVLGVIMPSEFTSQGTYRDALKLCANLKIKHYVVSIKNIYQDYLELLHPFFKRLPFDKTEENLQARIRGNVLMAFSNKFGWLVLNTGNKSEVSCGYCTLYGDMVGGFGLLKDVPKTLVYKLARYIKRVYGHPIPASVIKRPPSAELRPNQKDEDALAPYALLDKIINLYVENDLSKEEIIRLGYDKKTVGKIIKLIDKNEYKRRQAPPGVKITPKAFGKDRRMPITNSFKE